MNRPRLLDLFCGAGGCSVGYHRAGFDVVGVDHVPMPRYPFAFVQMDALEAMRVLLAGGYIIDNSGRRWYLADFDATHGSAPCQVYSKTRQIMGNEHPDLVAPTRELLQATGLPHVIENVPGAPLVNPVTLVGTMFGLRTMRPRLFECSFPVPFELAPPPHARQAKMGRPVRAGEFIQVVGHFSDVSAAGEAMGIDWMSRDELAQAIPPAFTEYIGAHLLAALPAPVTEGAA